MASMPFRLRTNNQDALDHVSETSTWSHMQQNCKTHKLEFPAQGSGRADLRLSMGKRKKSSRKPAPARQKVPLGEFTFPLSLLRLKH